MYKRRMLQHISHLRRMTENYYQKEKEDPPCLVAITSVRNRTETIMPIYAENAEEKEISVLIAMTVATKQEADYVIFSAPSRMFTGDTKDARPLEERVDEMRGAGDYQDGLLLLGM